MEPQKTTAIYDIAKKPGISPATVSRGGQHHPAIIKKEKRKFLTGPVRPAAAPTILPATCVTGNRYHRRRYHAPAEQPFMSPVMAAIGQWAANRH